MLNHLDYDTDEYRRIIRKLQAEDRIYDFVKNGETVYSLTFDGLLFIDDGGYITQTQRSNSNRLEKEAYDRRMESMATQSESNTSSLALRTFDLAKYTRWLAFGTIALVSVELLKEFHFFQWLLHCF